MKNLAVLFGIVLSITYISCNPNTIKKTTEDGFEIVEITDPNGYLVSITAINGTDTLIFEPKKGKQVMIGPDEQNCKENWIKCVNDCRASGKDVGGTFCTSDCSKEINCDNLSWLIRSTEKSISSDESTQTIKENK